VAAGLLLFARLRSPLLEPEDALYAEIPRHMGAGGDWVTPVHFGQEYYQKPPLLYWLILASYSCFGVQDWAARLIPCASALGIILVTFWWGTRTLGYRAGLAGAVILCLSPRFLHQARMITMDGLLAFWVLCGLALGQQAIQSGRLGWGRWLLSAAACGLGLLTKGPVALVLVAVPLLAYQTLDRRTARPSALTWLAYLGTALALAAPWFVTLAWRDPAFLNDFFWTHHVVMRFLQPLHEEPAWYYVPVLLLGMLPWSLLLPAMLRLLGRRSGPAARKRPAEVGFLLLCCSWCFLLFSTASCKRIGYILPAMPPLALALGYTLDRRLPGKASSAWGFLRENRGTPLAYWATQGVLAVGIGGTLLAAYSGLVKPWRCLALVVPAAAGMGWLAFRRLRQTPRGSWAACAFSTFTVLFLAVHFLLPGYYRRFSIRTQVRSLMGASYHPRTPVVCYPHYCDSVSFYLDRHDVRSYGSGDRDRLIADLHGSPETLVFVKTGKALNDLLHDLPDSLEFVPRGRSSWVTAGLLRRRSAFVAGER